MTSSESTEPPLVYSVVVNYRSPNDTKRCLASLVSQDYPNHKIVVVNNDDNIEEANAIRDVFPQCKMIAIGENLGFASGFNVGIRFALESGAEYVSILNNDTILDRQFIKASLRAFNHGSDVGMAGGKIYKFNDGWTDTIWTAGGDLSWLRARGVGYGFNERDRGQYDEERDVGFLPGAQMFVRREVFEKIGLLPDVYFLGGEEWEFCYRVLESGYLIRYTPDVTLWHEVGHSGTETYSTFYNDFRNRLIFTHRCYTSLGWIVWLCVFLVFAHSWLWIKYRNNRPKMVYFAAIRALYRTVGQRSFEISREEYELAQQRDE